MNQWVLVYDKVGNVFNKGFTYIPVCFTLERGLRHYSVVSFGKHALFEIEGWTCVMRSKADFDNWKCTIKGNYKVIGSTHSSVEMDMPNKWRNAVRRELIRNNMLCNKRKKRDNT